MLDPRLGRTTLLAAASALLLVAPGAAQPTDPDAPSLLPADPMRLGSAFILRQDARRFDSGLACEATFDISAARRYENVREVACEPDLGWRIPVFLTMLRAPEGAGPVEGVRARFTLDEQISGADDDVRWEILDPGRRAADASPQDPAAPQEAEEAERQVLTYRALRTGAGVLFDDAERFGSGFDCTVTFDLNENCRYENLRDMSCAPDRPWRLERAFGVMLEPECMIDGPRRREGVRARLVYDGPEAANPELRTEILDPGTVVSMAPAPQPEAAPRPRPEAARAPRQEAPPPPPDPGPFEPEPPIVADAAPAGASLAFSEADLAHAAQLAELFGPAGGGLVAALNGRMNQACRSYDQVRRTEPLVSHLREIDAIASTDPQWNRAGLRFFYRYRHPDETVRRQFSVDFADVGAIVESGAGRHLVCSESAGECVRDENGALAGRAIKLQCPEAEQALRTVQAGRIIAALPLPERDGGSVRGEGDLDTPPGDRPMSVTFVADQREVALILSAPNSEEWGPGYASRVFAEAPHLTASITDDGVLVLSCRPDRGTCWRRSRRHPVMETVRLRGDPQTLQRLADIVGGEPSLIDRLAERPFPFERYGLR